MENALKWDVGRPLRSTVCRFLLTLFVSSTWAHGSAETEAVVDFWKNDRAQKYEVILDDVEFKRPSSLKSMAVDLDGKGDKEILVSRDDLLNRSPATWLLYKQGEDGVTQFIGDVEVNPMMQLGKFQDRMGFFDYTKEDGRKGLLRFKALDPDNHLEVVWGKTVFLQDDDKELYEKIYNSAEFQPPFIKDWSAKDISNLVSSKGADRAPRQRSTDAALSDRSQENGGRSNQSSHLPGKKSSNHNAAIWIAIFCSTVFIFFFLRKKRRIS